MAELKAIVSLYRAREEKPIERYKTRFKVAEENKLFSSFQKRIRELKQITKTTATRTSLNKSFNEQNNSCAPQGGELPYETDGDARRLA